MCFVLIHYSATYVSYVRAEHSLSDLCSVYVSWVAAPVSHRRCAVSRVDHQSVVCRNVDIFFVSLLCFLLYCSSAHLMACRELVVQQQRLHPARRLLTRAFTVPLQVYVSCVVEHDCICVMMRL